MKKLLILFLFAGLVFSTTSCKKKTCPEPEKPKGIGTWKVSSVKYDDGAPITDPSESACLSNDVLVLGEDQKSGSWTWAYYLENSSTCGSLDLQIVSWAENFEKKKLYISESDGTNVYDDAFDFIDETHIKQTRVAGINASGTAYIIMEFQYEKQ